MSIKNIIHKINNLKNEWPRVSYIIVSKCLAIFGFSFFIWLTQLHLPFWQTLLIVMAQTLIFLPVSYWLTYYFQPAPKEKSNE